MSGLLAFGRCGNIEIEIDETPTGNDVTLTLPEIQLRFSIGSLAVIVACCSFIEDHVGSIQFSEIEVGRLSEMSVFLIKDDEFPDRFFLRGTGETGLFDIAFFGNSLREFLGALKSVAEDL